MAVPDIYPLAFLNDLLITKQAVTVNLQRNEELSGSGDGRYWAAEMAAPLWTADLTLEAMGRECVARARSIDAKFRALGVNRSFLWADPTYRGPASGATVELARANVTVSAIGTDRTALSFAGLPAGYALSAGDRFSIEWADGRFYMAELSEDRVAIATGAIASVGVYPYPPMGLVVGRSVDFVRPVFRAIVPNDGYTPHSYIRGFVAQGAAVKLLQKV